MNRHRTDQNIHPRFPEIVDRIIEWGIIFLLVFTPLAFGAVHLWAYSLMEFIICFLGILWIIKLLVIYGKKTYTVSNSKSVNPHTPFLVNRFGFVKTSLNIPIFIFVGLTFFQLISLPPGVLKFLSPHTYSLYEEVLLGWPEDEPFFEPENQTSIHQNTEISSIESHISKKQNLFSNWRTVSIFPYATKNKLLKVLAYIGMFFLIINNPTLKITRIIVIVISLGFFISFLGILQKLTGITKIYWIRDASYASSFGPYINRNHFAGYIGMVISLALGLLISRFARITFSQGITWRTLVETFESHLLGNIVLIFATMIMISASFLSLSRGGIISFLITIVVFTALIGFKRTKIVVAGGRKVLFSVLIVTFVFLLWIGLNPILDRLSDLSSTDRTVIYQNTIAMVKDFPFLGTGLGTFQYLYPRYKTLENQLLCDHTHNDYLELLSNSGLLGFLTGLGFIIMFFWNILAKWWKRRDPYAKGIGLGGICSVIAILPHSYADFNLHIPANALFLSFILGLTYNVVNLKSKC